ncbi:MAG: porin [Alphaproteobacteria bacterium]|nr:porin [Alphaproteobacteria bacterium]
MKNVLFATTALVALGLVPLAEAQAQDKKPAEKPISIRVGGYFQGQVVFGTNEDSTRRGVTGGNKIRNYGIGRESEIHFAGETQLNNGLRVGVQVELEGETSADQIDNTYLYFQHANWGRVILGEDWGSGLKVAKGTVGHITGIGANSHFASFGGDQRPGTNFVGGGRLNTIMILDSVNDKLIYDTPRIFGFRGSVSFAPDDKGRGSALPGGGGATGVGLNTKEDGFANISNVWTIGADYINTFGPVGVAFHAGYQRGYREDTNNGPTSPNSKDPDSFSLGAEVGMAGFRVGAAWKHINNNLGAFSAAVATQRGLANLGPTGANSFLGDRDDFTVGVDYTFGPWIVGATYGFARQEGVPTRVNNRSTDRLDQVTVGAAYTLGPGIALFGGYIWNEFDGKSGTGATQPKSGDNTAHLFLLGTRLTF